MTGDEAQTLDTARSQWSGVMIAGAAGAIPGFFAFTMAFSQPGLTSTTDWIAHSALLFGSLALGLVGLLGYARSKRRQQLGRERALGTTIPR